MEPWELAAREAIRDTIGRYAHAADSGRFDDLASLFTVDGVLEVHGEAPLAGRDAIRDYLHGVRVDLANATQVPLIRHHVTSTVIDVVDHDSARGACYFLAVTEYGVDHWGRYRDDYERDGDAWLFAHRRVRTDGATAGGWAAGRVNDTL
jgi:hypothetical protein